MISVIAHWVFLSVVYFTTQWQRNIAEQCASNDMDDTFDGEVANSMVDWKIQLLSPSESEDSDEVHGTCLARLQTLQDSLRAAL